MDPVLAHPYDIARVQAPVTARDNDGQGGFGAAGLNLPAAFLPVKVLITMGIGAAEHNLCAVDEGGANRNIDGQGAQTGAFSHHVVFYREGRSLYIHALAQVGGHRFYCVLHHLAIILVL